MNRTTQSLLTAAALLWVQAWAQAGPNTIAQFNPANRTMSFNGTFCIVPIPKDEVRPITGYDPIDVPASILPSFPDGMHPLLFQGGYQMDIRMTALNVAPLQIPGLTQASLIVPFTDVVGDGETPVNVPVNYYIGGTDGNFLEAIVPSIVAGVPLFEGTNIAPATVVPDTAAVEALSGGFFNFQTKPYLLPNPISGPGVQGEALQLLYELTTDSPYSDGTFHRLLNSPQLLNTGLCQRNTQYFNETFVNARMGRGNLTLYNQPLLATPPKEIAGRYEGVYCYQANSQSVSTFVGETCSVAESNYDRSSRH